jgi:hypothetical protein
MFNYCPLTIDDLAAQGLLGHQVPAEPVHLVFNGLVVSRPFEGGPSPAAVQQVAAADVSPSSGTTHEGSRL